MKLYVSILVLTACSFAQQAKTTNPAHAAKPATPASADLKLEIAVAQRDLVLANSNMKQAIDNYKAAEKKAGELQQTLNEKFAEAGKSCTDKQEFDPTTLVCVDKKPAQ